MADLLQRPSPRRRGPGAARSLIDELIRWLIWIGPARLIGGAVAAAALVVVVVLTLRVPSPPQISSADGMVEHEAAPVFTLPPLAPLEAPAPETVTVHVAGAVLHPGVHELDAGSRVVAAIDAAGGIRADALLDVLNLAAELIDGQRIYVPVVGEAVPGPDPLPGSVGDADAPRGPIDLNRATVDELVTLPGVGPVTAAAIVTDRDRAGPFASVDDLIRVRGIGPAKLAAIRDLVTV